MCSSDLIELPVGELDRIRKEILNVAAQDSDLDSTSLENHLKATGLSEALERLLRRSLYDHWSCVAPEADRAEARTIVRAIVLGWEGLALLAEVSAEEANLPLDLPEEEWAAYWNRLRLKRRQALEMGDEDGEAAGAFGPP